MVFLIGDDDLERAGFMPEEVIAAVEDAYRQDGLGLAQDTPRREVRTKGKELPHIAPGAEGVGQGLAYLEGSGVLMIHHGLRFDRRQYVAHLLDPSGRTLAIILRERVGEEGIGVMDLRTGAACAVGARYLARQDVDAVGVVGTGRVGRASLLCLAKVRRFDRVYAHSGRRRDEGFAREMGRTLGVDVIAAETAEEVARRADILVTATFATAPLVRGEWLREGAHVCGMGADDPVKVELDAEVLRRASRVVVDGEKCMTSVELADPIRRGLLRTEDIHKIGEVVAGRRPGREDDSEVTVFKSDGTNIQTAGVMWLIYRKAKELGLGIETSRLRPYLLGPGLDAA